MKDLDCGFEYIVSLIDPITPMGREQLRNLPFMTSANEITESHQRQLDMAEKERKVASIKVILSRIRDIRGTLSNLSSGIVLDDIELFEIKSFAYWCGKLKEELGRCASWMKLPDLSVVFSVLDPDNSGTESFYISDDCDDSLGGIRKEIHRLQRIEVEDKESELNRLLQENVEIENRVRARLSKRLLENCEALYAAMKIIGKIDLTVALTELNRKLGLEKPDISSGEYEFQELVNPEISRNLNLRGKEFKPFSAKLGKKVVIIGGNMTGKSVLLRTVALLQTMFQHGLFVPARNALIPVYDTVIYFSGDKQSFVDGLSSFAGEIEHLRKAIEIVDSDTSGLFLFDEIGRSTNPVEGPAFLMASAEYLCQSEKCRSVFTSHYEEALGIEDAQIFIIKGVDQEKVIKEKGRDVSYYVDHSLVEMGSNESFPKEAITIARLMGLDREFIQLIKRKMKGGCE
ncbi:permease [Mesotoga sp.]|uniref:MutS-related protein n=1 Tax=Mesotoga sp. TaxID=2053577 RepID=UPI00345E09B0